MVFRRRAEIPEDRLALLSQQRETAHLVLSPRTDVRRRDVAHVVHVEAKDRTYLGLGEEVLHALETLFAEPVKIDALLPVNRHPSKCWKCHEILMNSNISLDRRVSGQRQKPFSRLVRSDLQVATIRESAHASRLCAAQDRRDNETPPPQ